MLCIKSKEENARPAKNLLFLVWTNIGKNTRKDFVLRNAENLRGLKCFVKYAEKNALFLPGNKELLDTVLKNVNGKGKKE